MCKQTFSFQHQLSHLFKEMKVVGILLIILGVIGIAIGLMMFGDIGVACIVGALAALLSGFGFLSVNNKLNSSES
ncbi:hypothetical protein ACIA39_08595 [Lactobacillus delbrueckii subsp. bulgaricus]